MWRVSVLSAGVKLQRLKGEVDNPIPPLLYNDDTVRTHRARKGASRIFFLLGAECNHECNYAT
jgi:hypothetical protein